MGGWGWGLPEGIRVCSREEGGMGGVGRGVPEGSECHQGGRERERERQRQRQRKKTKWRVTEG